MALRFLCPAQASFLSHCFHKEVTGRLPGCRPFSLPVVLSSFPGDPPSIPALLP